MCAEQLPRASRRYPTQGPGRLRRPAVLGCSISFLVLPTAALPSHHGSQRLCHEVCRPGAADSLRSTCCASKCGCNRYVQMTLYTMRPGAGVCCRKHLAPDVVKFQCWLQGPSLKASRMPPDVYCRSLSDETATWARQQHRFVLTMDNGTNFVCRARPKEAASLTLRWVTYRLAE